LIFSLKYYLLGIYIFYFCKLQIKLKIKKSAISVYDVYEHKIFWFWGYWFCLYFYTFFLLDFGTVLTVRYFSPILCYRFILFLTRNETNIIYSRLWYLYISIDILDFCSKYPNHTRTKYFVFIYNINWNCRFFYFQFDL
jgi:hypothetical protein